MRYAPVSLVIVAAACGSDAGTVDAGSGGDDTAAVVDSWVVDTLPCGQLLATFRDFQSSHPDFEETNQGDDLAIVATTLGTDGKPVYASNGPTQTVQSQASFNQWYRDVNNVNMTFTQPITLTEGPPGTFTFEDPDFFPLDGMGFPETFLGHNFHFTTELHGTIVYRGGETFTFTGDDDVFIYVNNRLALNLGGVHGAETATIDFDARASELGLSIGGTYQFDAFHAERHTSESNFKMTTTIDCFVIL